MMRHGLDIVERPFNHNLTESHGSARLVDQARRATEFHSSEFKVFVFHGESLGWVQPDFARLLCRWPEYFKVRPHQVILHPDLSSVKARTQALAQCIRQLAREGHIRGWRDENYQVFSAQDSCQPLFYIERAAVRRFGLASHGVHLNAYVVIGNSLRMWIARRSSTKSIDPGLLDNLVGGGVAAAYSPWQTLVKESSEEAGIGFDRVKSARQAGQLLSRHATFDGVHNESLHVYDLRLPGDFVPRSQDGEVSAFRQVEVATLTRLIAEGQFTVEAGLVALDFLLRHNLLTNYNPDVEDLKNIVTSRYIACNESFLQGSD